MKWQDYVVSSGLFIFTIALIPSIRSKDKPALFTSIMTSAVMYIFSLTFITLGLYATAVGQLFGASAWATLAIQKHLQIRQARAKRDRVPSKTKPSALPNL